MADIVFEEINNEELNKYKFYFKVGSILSDVVPTFLWKKHRIDITNSEFKRSVYNFLNSKYHGRLYSVRAGIITHYLSDYFTFPHNKECHWNLWIHNAYEGRQLELMKNLRSIHELITFRIKSFYQISQVKSLDELFNEIERLHNEYIIRVQEVSNQLDIDLYYIECVSYFVMSFLVKNSLNYKSSYAF